VSNERMDTASSATGARVVMKECSAMPGLAWDIQNGSRLLCHSNVRMLSTPRMSEFIYVTWETFELARTSGGVVNILLLVGYVQEVMCGGI